MPAVVTIRRLADIDIRNNYTEVIANISITDRQKIINCTETPDALSTGWHDEWSVSIINRLHYIMRMRSRLLLLLQTGVTSGAHCAPRRPASQSHSHPIAITAVRRRTRLTSRDFISATVNLASPSVASFCYRYAIHLQQHLWMIDFSSRDTDPEMNN